MITQAKLKNDVWHGRADVLLRIDRPSGLGDWSYEVVDTKLARETKAGTILQLCLYSELVAKVQKLIDKIASIAGIFNLKSIYRKTK